MKYRDNLAVTVSFSSAWPMSSGPMYHEEEKLAVTAYGPMYHAEKKFAVTAQLSLGTMHAWYVANLTFYSSWKRVTKITNFHMQHIGNDNDKL